MKTFSPEISLSLLILFLISQQLLFYYLFCYKILTKQVTAMNTKIILSFLLIIFSITACNTTEPPEGQSLNLKLEDVSCTEAWITLTTTNLQLPTTLLLKQDGETREAINVETEDTLLYIDSLLPNQTYVFQSVIQSINQSSNELILTTMDTTSHNFTFETFTFGNFVSSTFFDVAIVGDEIWAVGEIQIADTSINGYTTYNAVHWNGNEWELKRILYDGNIWTIKTIFAFNENDIWFSAFVRFDGENFIELPIPGILVGWTPNKIWGRSSNDLYVVGDNSNIALYRNGNWQRIESGTDTDFKDIFGTPDGKELWTCGWTNRNGRVAIVKIKESGVVESIWDSQTNRTYSYYYSGQLLNTIWANGNGEFVFATGVVTRHSLLDKRIVRYEWVPYLNGSKVLELGNYAYRIRGSNKNNIAVAGDEAMIWHYNGVTWHKFEELEYFDDRLYSLAVTDNLIIAVGKRYSGLTSGALLLVGRR